MMLKIDWLDPIRLSLADDDSEIALVRRLKSEIKEATSDWDLGRSVYLIRLAGRAVIVYDNDFHSPLVYVGRGDSVRRLASHLKRWATEAFTWGQDTELEIRILCPSLKNDDECFKNVEADLLRWFHDRAGMLPLINSRFEKSYEGAVRYSAKDKRRLQQLLQVGSGRRPYRAIYPMRSNPHYDRYWKNW